MSTPHDRSGSCSPRAPQERVSASDGSLSLGAEWNRHSERTLAPVHRCPRRAADRGACLPRSPDRDVERRTDRTPRCAGDARAPQSTALETRSVGRSLQNHPEAPLSHEQPSTPLKPKNSSPGRNRRQRAQIFNIPKVIRGDSARVGKKRR